MTRVNALIDERPLWPHDDRPPSSDLTRPLAYVTEMTAIGVQLGTGPDAVVQAVKQGLSPAEFIQQVEGQHE